MPMPVLALSIVARVSSRRARGASAPLARALSSSTPPTTPQQQHEQQKQKPPSHCFQVWGANTDVGKTVFSAALLRTAALLNARDAAADTHAPTAYIKPVQTGYPAQDDASVVTAHTKSISSFTLYTYPDPLSPDLAARNAQSADVSDAQLCDYTTTAINTFMSGTPDAPPPLQQSTPPLILVETAGGVLSPAPSGTPQADAYRPLRLQSILLADPALGGISTTLAAFEALHSRGYDVPAVVLLPLSTHDHPDAAALDNASSVDAALRPHQPRTTVFQAPPLPRRDRPLNDYFLDPATTAFFNALLSHLRSVEGERRARLADMPARAKQMFWYPFTQHATLEDVTPIDSAHGDHYVVHDADASTAQRALFDAAGSWWTNGVGHGHPRVAAAIAAAAGRYGHVIFPEMSHAPADELSERLLRGAGDGWATRVFFSDNGSTAVEVALKMAFRKRAVDAPERADLPYVVATARDSYHGDTLGAMNCSEKSAFNELQTPWYEPRALFFEQPTLALRNGVWTVLPASWMMRDDDDEDDDEDDDSADDEHGRTFASRREAFSKHRVVPLYNAYVADRLDAVLHAREVDIGALLLEPVLMGAGGMHVVDPAFQRALVEECRARGIPVAFDEIFSGLWRLGVQSAAELLGMTPDVAAFGKLLTGGTVPLSVTLATEEVKRAFDGATKREALLHGHSYTAHPIGCAAGVESLRVYDEEIEAGRTYWCEDFAKELSAIDRVKRVTVIGTVLAVELESDKGGYAATGAAELMQRLNEEGIAARPLGNVLYMVCTPLTEKHVCDEKMRVLARVLDSDDDVAEAKG